VAAVTSCLLLVCPCRRLRGAARMRIIAIFGQESHLQNHCRCEPAPRIAPPPVARVLCRTFRCCAAACLCCVWPSWRALMPDLPPEPGLATRAWLPQVRRREGAWRPLPVGSPPIAQHLPATGTISVRRSRGKLGASIQAGWRCLSWAATGSCHGGLLPCTRGPRATPRGVGATSPRPPTQARL
jgi:hypothetical protein